MPDQTPSMPPLPEPVYRDRFYGEVACDCYHDDQMHAYAQAVADERVREAQQWRPIETAPQDGRKVILFYLNRNNKARTVMARWLTDEEAEESDEDGVGLECGWYECIDNWDDFAQVAIHEGEPTHWMPLPPGPTLSLAGSKETP